MGGAPQAFHKCRFIITGTGHFCCNYFIGERQTAVRFAEIERPAHRIAAGIAGKTGFGHVKDHRRRLARGSVRGQDGLQVPGAAKGARVGGKRLCRSCDDGVGLMLFRFGQRALTGGQKEYEDNWKKFHGGVSGMVFKNGAGRSPSPVNHAVHVGRRQGMRN